MSKLINNKEIILTNFKKKNISVQYFKNRKMATSYILKMIPPYVTVARGDSLTVDQIGLMNMIRKRNKNKVIDPFASDKKGHWIFTAEERERMERESFSSDIYITGTNAMTTEGQLVNIDGHGNRVSAMIFGPLKVIIVVGVNKLVRNLEEALMRIKRICAPQNARRHYFEHQFEKYGSLPCVKSGRCTNCFHEHRICHYTAIIDGCRKNERGRFNVVLIDEELGL